MNDIKKLKSLLLQDEIYKIDKVMQKISLLEDKQKKEFIIENFSTDISEILLKNMQKHPNDLYGTLQPIISKAINDELNKSHNNLIVSSSIEKQVQKHKSSVIDAFYPILGKLFSKYFTTKANKIIYKVDSIMPRIKSKKYKSNLSFIKEVLLLQKDSGLLIAKQTQDKSSNSKLSIRPSVMSAIKIFVKKSGRTEDDVISEMKYGNSYIYIIQNSPYCYMVILASQQITIEEKASKILKSIVSSNAHEIYAYDGDSTKVNILDINRKLSTFFKDDTQEKTRTPVFGILLISIMLSAPILYFSYQGYLAYKVDKKENNIRNILKENGIKIYDLSFKSSKETTIIDGLLLKNSDLKKTKQLFKELNIVNNISSVDNNFKINYDIEQLKILTKKINKKYNSNIEYSINDNSVTLRGTVINKHLKNNILKIYNSYLSSLNISYDLNVLEKVEDRIYFNAGSNLISPRFDHILDRVANIHKKYNNYFIKVSLYTDSSGGDETNKKVSDKRAIQINSELRKRGVPLNKIIVNINLNPPTNLLLENSVADDNGTLSRCAIFNWEIAK